MTSLADRLRGVLRGEGSPGPGARDSGLGARDSGLARDAAAETLGGEWCGSDGQRFLVVERAYTPGHRHGKIALADGLPPTHGGWPRLSLLAGGAACGCNPLFIDLETTGLAGGAGTYAFLVGCAWFDGGRFRVRQFFLAEYGAERALLEALAALVVRADTLVTYNGKTFDVPLIDTRFVLYRMQGPFAAMPHVDMLHPARRLWRADDADVPGAQPSGRLSAIEQVLCGPVREGDVPGFEIPGRYFHFVRSGDARPIEAVLEHNRLDLISLAMLTARAAQLLNDGPDAAATAREALGLGRLYERGGMLPDARIAYVRATHFNSRDPDGDAGVRADALRAYALLCRRQRLYADAASAWRQLLAQRLCPPNVRREATEALAVHHEHRVRDLLTARTFAQQSLDIDGSAAQRHSLEHRLARLDRKLDRSARFKAQHPRLLDIGDADGSRVSFEL